MHALRSFRIIDGKIEATLTKEDSERRISASASSNPTLNRAMVVDSRRFGRRPARTRMMLLVSSKSCSMSSERWSLRSSPAFAEGWSNARFRAISTITFWMAVPSVSAKRSRLSIVSEKIASWYIALPDIMGRRILLRAWRISILCDVEVNWSTRASKAKPNNTKKNATGSSR